MSLLRLHTLHRQDTSWNMAANLNRGRTMAPRCSLTSKVAPPKRPLHVQVGKLVRAAVRASKMMGERKKKQNHTGLCKLPLFSQPGTQPT